VTDLLSLAGPYAHFRHLLEEAPLPAFVKDAEGRYVYANKLLLAATRTHLSSRLLGKTDSDLWPPAAAATIRRHNEAALNGAGPQVYSLALPFANAVHHLLIVEFAMPAGDSSMGVGGVAIDVSEDSRKEAERDRLAAAVEQAAESVMITDLDARIIYVNPAFERVTGYRSAEVIGQNPRFLKSDLQPPWFYEAMWAALTNGLPWVASFVNRRKDGSLFAEEAVISPIRDASGAVTSFVAVKRDVTSERALEERSAKLREERALIAETIRSMRAGDTPEATAQAICRRVGGFTGVMAAHLSLFGLDGRVAPIGFVVPGQSDPPLQPLPIQLSRGLLERAADGPWIEPWVSEPSSPYDALLSSLGVDTLAYAPVRHEQRVIGLLGVHVQGPAEELAAAQALPALAEFADLAGVLIGRSASERDEARRGYERVSEVIERRAFRPVFQPIVDIAHDSIVGYEALTRFAAGPNPEAAFAEAAAVGLGVELETATLKAALAASKALPATGWLNLNASPEFIMSGEPLRALLAGSRRHLVLEVTEHAAIDEYATFRAAVAALGPTVELAVDDAGSGFASLRHILELRPAFVKLDRSLVAGLDTDDARQAMIVGLRYFAGSSGCRLIAEGIETEAELTTLRSLGVPLGQGYLLGRPQPVDAEPVPLPRS
jgi:PAS domain S-box-containing protein